MRRLYFPRSRVLMGSALALATLFGGCVLQTSGIGGGGAKASSASAITSSGGGDTTIASSSTTVASSSKASSGAGGSASSSSSHATSSSSSSTTSSSGSQASTSSSTSSGTMDGGETDAGPICSNNLSNIGTGDFRVSFTLTTSQMGTVAVVNQRDICGAGDFWDVRLQDGKLFIETDEINDAGAVLDSQIHGCAMISDGMTHDVVVQRVQRTVFAYVDGRFDLSGSSPASFASLPALEMNVDICDTDAGPGTYALMGTLSNVCVSRTSTVQPDAGSCGG